MEVAISITQSDSLKLYTVAENQENTLLLQENEVPLVHVSLGITRC